MCKHGEILQRKLLFYYDVPCYTTRTVGIAGSRNSYSVHNQPCKTSIFASYSCRGSSPPPILGASSNPAGHHRRNTHKRREKKVIFRNSQCHAGSFFVGTDKLYLSQLKKLRWFRSSAARALPLARFICRSSDASGIASRNQVHFLDPVMKTG